jgi:polar amino acid transport system permease protein
VSYTFQWGQVIGYIPYLMGGAWLALQVAFLAFLGGIAIATFNAAVLSFGTNRLLRGAVSGYVIFFMNTPLLVQIFFLFFALPEIGILLNSYEAVLLGMTLNVSAYLTQIQRAGFQSMNRGELEAAVALGMSLLQMIWYVILPHICKVLYPPLTNQYILLTLTTSLAAIFGLEELTGRAYNVNAITFRSFEVFTLAAGIYVVLTLFASAVLLGIGRWLFRVKAKVF